MGSGEHGDSEPIIAFAGGGTGGHIYPALALTHALRERIPSARFLFFCTERKVDGRILDDADGHLVRQPLHNLSKLPWRWPKTLRGWSRARRLCRRTLAEMKPVVVFGTGGLASVPAILEARHAGIPTAILNPDARPGKANRFLSGRVDVVFAQWEATRDYLSPRQLAVLGCPIRPEFATATRNDGIQTFGLDATKKTLLVTGASQGARSINDALIALAPTIEALRDWQVLHLTGDSDQARVARAYHSAKLPAKVLAYTDRMPDALAACDLVVSRAGASTLAEITATARASILLPYPYHRDQHQLENARCLAKQSAAQILPDRIGAKENAPALWEKLRPLLTDDASRLAMSAAAGQMAKPDAALAIADRVLELAKIGERLRAGESVKRPRTASR